MKNYRIFFALISLVLVSCERAAESTSKIKISLPTNSSVASNLSVLNALNVSILANDDLVGEEDFLPITPTGYTAATGDKIINCYLVAVSAPDTKGGQNNFCGKRNATSNLIDANYIFGQYMGLMPAGSTIEMDVFPGENKQIYVFGTHSIDTNSCKDLSLNPSKSNFSKLHAIGTSSVLKLEPGAVSEVVIPLQPPTASNQVDDCILATDINAFAPASHITVEKKSFPYQVFRKYTSASARCEPIDVMFLSVNNITKAAASSVPVTASLYFDALSTPVIKNTYDSYNNCSSDISASSSFLIAANSPIKRVWARLLSTDPTSTDLSVANNTGLTSITKHFKISFNTSSDFSTTASVPSQVEPGVCYPISVGYRPLNGTLNVGSASASSMDITLAGLRPILNTPVADFYDNDPTCTAAAQTVFNIAASNFFPTNQVYMKVPATLSTTVNSLNFTVTKTAGPQNAYTSSFNIRISREIALAPKVSNIRMVYKDAFAKNICIPLVLNFLDQKGNMVNITSGDKINIIGAESSYNQVSIHDNDPTCTGGSDLSSFTPANEIT
ncbi:MAG: hypothetical protein ABL930_13770, partial [Pseudobdellovibrio sp.]